MGLSTVLGLVALGALLAWASDPRRVPITRVAVEGDLGHIDRRALDEAIGEEVARGFFRADLARVRRAVRELPWVEAVWVRRQWPGALALRIRERRAAARWRGGGLVDAAGVWFRPRRLRGTEGLPLLAGPPGSQARVLRRYRALREQLAPTGRAVEGVELDRRYAWRATLSGGLRLVLGRAPPERSVRRFSRLFSRLQAQHGGEMVAVDFRYPNGFAIRWRSPRGTHGQVGG